MMKGVATYDKDGNITGFKKVEDIETGVLAKFKETVMNIADGFGKTWKGLADEFAFAGIDINGKVDSIDQDQSENTLKGAFSKASQKSITLIAGQFGRFGVDLIVVKDNTSVIRALQTQGWNDVRAIKDLTVKVEQNTNRIAGIADKIEGSLGEISRDTRRSADVLDGGTINAKVKM